MKSLTQYINEQLVMELSSETYGRAELEAKKRGQYKRAERFERAKERSKNNEESEVYEKAYEKYFQQLLKDNSDIVSKLEDLGFKVECMSEWYGSYKTISDYDGVKKKWGRLEFVDSEGFYINILFDDMLNDYRLCIGGSDQNSAEIDEGSGKLIQTRIIRTESRKDAKKIASIYKSLRPNTKTTEQDFIA